MINVVEMDKPDDHWNARLLESCLGQMVQTKERSVNYTRRGESPLFLQFVDQKGEIVGQNLIGILPRFRSRKGKKILQNLPGIKKFTYFWTDGPIIFDSKKSDEIHTAFKDYLLSKNVRILGKTNPLLSFNNSIFKKNFQLQEWATSIIDLSKPLDVLYKNISRHSGRKNIEKSEKRGVKIEFISEENLNDYVIVQNEFRLMQKIETTTYEHYLDWWNLMKPIGYGGFVAKKDGIPVGGLLFSFFNKVIVEAGVARSKIDFTEKLYSQDLIKWKIIQWGHENGMRYYDLAGYNPYPKQPKEKGIKRFKEKWGGEKHSYWIIKK